MGLLFPQHADYKLVTEGDSGVFHIYGTGDRLIRMKPQSVRTTVDIPVGLYRRLKVQAAARGCSARELILLGIRKALLKDESPRPKHVRFPLIVAAGPKVDLTNEQMYEYVEFP